MNKEVLITGAAGFSGSHQVDTCMEKGQSVIGVVRETSSLDNLVEAEKTPNFTLAKLDLASAEDVHDLLKSHKPNTVIHLAAHSNVNESIANPKETLFNNLSSTLNILRAAAEHTPKSTIILTGSSHEIGTPTQELTEGIDETIPLNPQNPYAQSKVLENIFIDAFTKQYGLRIVKARVFNHSGPRRTENFLDGKLAKEAAQAKINNEKWLVKIGNKRYTRDWQHVKNWNDANLILAESGRTGEIYNVASGQPHSHEQFIDSLAQTLGIQFEIIEDNALLRPGDPLKTFANNEKLRHIGWNPEKSFEDMIEDSASYWINKLQQ